MRARVSRLPVGLAIVALFGCATPKPEQELAVSDVEAYWAIDSTAGDTVYLSPVVRLRLTNRSATRAIEATASFRRQGDPGTWGSAWERVTLPARPLPPGQAMTLVLKSDGRYSTTGVPESIFQHELFKDASVEVFFRVGSSAWVKMAAADVERRIGSKSLGTLAPSPAPSAAP